MNFLYRIYFLLPNFKFLGIFGKIINRILTICLKRVFDMTIPWYLGKTSGKAGLGINTEARDEEFIVSLTSFPARIDDIWITIETILRQSFKPDKIILWLAEEQFPDKKLPHSLTKLESRGLAIKYCEDLRSHKKYYYTMKENPESIIITLDDDSYYPRDVIKDLVALHKKYPETICANRAHKIKFENGKIKPYRQWEINCKKFEEPTKELVPTGVGGVLYPAGVMDSILFDKDLFSEICFFADDLWLKMCSLKKGTKVISNKYYNKDLVAVSRTQENSLLSNNSFGGGNDEQMLNLLNYFKIDLISEINEDIN